MTPERMLPHDRWQVTGAFLTIVILAVAISVWNEHRIDQAEARIARNTKIAIAAHAKANRAETSIENFKMKLQLEKVCTESNRGEACRALFERLAEDLSDSQRRELACSVARELQLPQYRVFCG